MEIEPVAVPARLLARGRRDEVVHAARWAPTPSAGDGDLVQVCLHGLGGSHANWILLGRLLAGNGEVWAPDLAGFGLTESRGRSASVEDNIDLSAGFVEAVGRGRPVVLLGNSMGGHIAYSLAAERPDLVAGLVLISPAVPPLARVPDRTVARRFLAFATPLVGEAYLARRKRTSTAAEEVRETMAVVLADPGALDPSAFRAHVAMTALRRRREDTHASLLVAARSLGRRLGPGRRILWQGVADISAPALILQGARDRLIERAACDRLAARRPDWEYRVYPELGHMAMLEDPERVAADIARWYASLAG